MAPLSLRKISRKLRLLKPAPPSGQPPSSNNQAPYANLSAKQLGRLVAPITLYSNALVAQILAASSFPVANH